jgi:uncharacterized Zn-finger protein
MSNTPIAAISLPREVILANKPTVCCNGGGGALGHPAVYLTVARDSGQVTCTYCGRVYMLAENAAGH